MIAFMVAGTFHVPSAIKKSFVFGATALGVCLLLCYSTRSVPATLLRHSERACYFVAIQGVREFRRLRVHKP